MYIFAVSIKYREHDIKTSAPSCWDTLSGYRGADKNTFRIWTYFHTARRVFLTFDPHNLKTSPASFHRCGRGTPLRGYRGLIGCNVRPYDTRLHTAKERLPPCKEERIVGTRTTPHRDKLRYGEGCMADHEGRFISSLYLAHWFKLSSALEYGGYKGRGCVLT